MWQLRFVLTTGCEQVTMNLERKIGLQYLFPSVFCLQHIQMKTSSTIQLHNQSPPYLQSNASHMYNRRAKFHIISFATFCATAHDAIVSSLSLLHPTPVSFCVQLLSALGPPPRLIFYPHRHAFRSFSIPLSLSLSIRVSLSRIVCQTERD